MGKSAKAFKRLTKKQKEIKKLSRTPQSQGPATASANSVVSSKVATGNGGSVSKNKTTKLKAKLAAAKNNSKHKKKDYMNLFSRK